MEILSMSPLENAMIEDSARSIRRFLDDVTAKGQTGHSLELPNLQ
jgi:hypothetical protein